MPSGITIQPDYSSNLYDCSIHYEGYKRIKLPSGATEIRFISNTENVDNYTPGKSYLIEGVWTLMNKVSFNGRENSVYFAKCEVVNISNPTGMILFLPLVQYMQSTVLEP